MKKLLVLLFLWAGTSFAQSPFEGTWITNRDTVQLRDKQTEYLGAKGMMQCVGCTANSAIKGDERQQKIMVASPWYTAGILTWYADLHRGERGS